MNIPDVTPEEQVSILLAFITDKMLTEGFSIRGNQIQIFKEKAKKWDLDPEKSVKVASFVYMQATSMALSGSKNAQL